ncbi:MAG: hypothetical protein LBF61_12495 [Azoarcus sp.]|jgi:hypothetical protein|nr:hypothetical protein [Azoarcus sp.]
MTASATPIFRSTSQALHFAYLIEAYGVSIDSVMSKAIRRIMMELGIWNTGEPSTVNFGGLSALEVRAQCAMIRAAVRSRLPGPESWAVEARYGINKIITENGQHYIVFQSYRYDAVLRLGDWLRPSFPALSPITVDILVARAVDKRVCTYRAMAKQMGISKDACARALKRIRERLQELENIAIDRLTPQFVADGLVAPQ